MKWRSNARASRFLNMTRIWNKHKQTNTPLKRKVFVGLSGGADSAVAAALLKERGLEVIGVFMRLAPEETVGSHDEIAAREIAKKLEIPFLVWDCRGEFKKAVIDYFLRELAAGRTPNPCVVCNQRIKFGLFLKKALQNGAEFVATGHYARLRRAVRGGKTIYELFRAKDKSKDQSYFLHRLNQAQLSKIIFPLGDYNKKQVIALAKQRRLPCLARESRDICFVNDYSRFLAKHLPAKMNHGKIIDAVGRILGEHNGLALFTPGQRVGIGGQGPFYAVKKDLKKNILFVSNDKRDLFQKEIRIKNINWLVGAAPALPLVCRVQIRYSGKAAKAKIIRRNSFADVVFNKPQLAPAPGQSAVFYDALGKVLGGGVIW